MPPDVTPEEAEMWVSPFVFVPPVTPMDDHAIHIQEHQDVILAYWYEAQASGNQALVIAMQAMMDHWNMHIQLQSQMMEQQAFQQAKLDAYTKGNTESQIMLKQVGKLMDAKVKQKQIASAPAK